MKRAILVLVGGTVAASAAALLACNAVLGIGAATLEADAGDGGAAVGDGGSAGEAGRSLSCDYYCSTIAQNCTQNFAEYVGSEDASTLCESMCPVFDPGISIGPTNDDTLGCRIYYAEQAASDPATNCRFAGPLGGMKCGTNPCEIFCSLDVQYCNNSPIDAGQYATTNDCLAVCGGDGGFPYQVPPPDAGCPPEYDLMDCSNTLNCRFWHLENAYGSVKSGQFHCPHTAQVSPVCN
jgi:hypothetical protein